MQKINNRTKRKTVAHPEELFSILPVFRKMTHIRSSHFLNIILNVLYFQALIIDV